MFQSSAENAPSLALLLSSPSNNQVDFNLTFGTQCTCKWLLNNVQYGISRMLESWDIQTQKCVQFCWTPCSTLIQKLSGDPKLGTPSSVYLHLIFEVNIIQAYHVIQCIIANEIQFNKAKFWKCLSKRNCGVFWQTRRFEISSKIFQFYMFSNI